MTHSVIKTENYLLVVDESEIKDTNWIYYKHFGEDIVCKYDRMNGKNTNVNEHKPFYQKIIYHLPLNAPILEGVPLLPPLEIVRYDFAEMFYNICKATYPNFDEWIEAKEYNKAKALQQPKYPVAFECEMIDKGEEDWIGDDITGEPFWNQKLEPKTITNSQGLRNRRR
jgi:hypothetical protein